LDPPFYYDFVQVHVVDYTATIAESRDAILSALEETGAASMSVALVDGEKVIWSEAFGVADKSTGKAPTTDTLYGIGSVSKMLATISVMKLVEQGLVKLDDPLVKYLPTFSMLSPEYRDITVRMLINHSSGFGGTDYRNAFMSTPFSGYAEQVQEALKGERLKHEPGYMNVYCNDGFTMVEILVKALTGQSYPEFVRQEILVPLGMNNSRFALKIEDLLPGIFANSYVQGQLMTPEFVSVYASGGLFSTPSDMSRLAMMLMNGGILGATRILSPASLSEMGTDQTIGTFNPLPSDFLRYGLGWDTVTQPGMKAVGIKGWSKNGGTSAYTAEFHVLPEDRLAVTVLTDLLGGTKALPIAEQILLRALVERGRLAAMPTPLPQQTTLPEVTPSHTDEEAISGFYAANRKLKRASFAADHSLSIEVPSNDGWSPIAKNLKLRTDGWYTSDDNATLSYSPVIGDGRRYLAMRTKYGYGHYSITIMDSEKLYAKPQVTAAWQARTSLTFLPANLSMYDRSFMNIDNLRFKLKSTPILPGYLFTPENDILDASVDDALARMFLQIPQNSGRDLSDVTVIARDGEEWFRQGSTLFRPLTGVPLLADGPSTVTIGDEGFSEWCKLPASGSVFINGASEWRLYDADFNQTASGTGNGSAVLPGSGTAAYLMLFGLPGTTLTLNLASAQ
jgi:CubicO group peptidase (beta-lactamase class C family)